MEKIQRLTSEQRGNFVAYLDGELEDEGARGIEQVLAKSSVARHEVDMLARTWDLLDSLPRPQVSEEFTHKTLASLQIVAADQPAAPAIGSDFWMRAGRRAFVAAVWLLALSVSAVLGYMCTSRWVPNRGDEVLRVLPVLENFEGYQEVRDIEFLRELKRRGLTDAPSADPQP